MAALAPFASRPRLAVAVSGGVDSMALALLAHRWVEGRDGQLTALIVDHRLRPESTREAVRVARRLAALAIESVVLPWLGEKPVTAIPETARAVRYRLLGAWCGENAVTDLLVGHHAEDLAETLWMRLARGDEVEGLAAMRPVTYTSWGRILRPFLSVAPEALHETLRQARVSWVEDPGNADPRFERARWRAMAPKLAEIGLDRDRMGELARLAARVGDVLDDATARWLATSGRIDPLGFAELNIRELGMAPSPVAARALQRLIAVIGGTSRRPSPRRARFLLASITSGAWRGRVTLGRVLLTGEGETLTLCRERRHLPPPCVVVPGEAHHWDGRFTVKLEDGPGGQDGRTLWLRPLIASDWRAINAARDALGEPRRTLPPIVWSTLPVLADAHGAVALPLLTFQRSDAPAIKAGMAFRPRLSATCGAYFLA